MSSLVLRVAGLLATFGLGVVLARVLEPAGYGRYGLVISVSALLVNFALLGTPQLAVRELSLRSDRGDWTGIRQLHRAFMVATLSIAIALGGIAVAISFAIVGIGPVERLYVAQGAILTPLLVLTALIAAELRGLGAMIRGQVLDIFARPAAAFALTLVLFASGTPLTADRALWIQIAVTLAAAAVSLAWIRTAIPPAAKQHLADERPRWLMPALSLGVVDVLRQLDGVYGIILMGWLATDAELGIFRVALSCTALVNMPVTIGHVILAPTISRLHHDGDQAGLQRLLTATSAVLVAVIAAILLVLWLAGRWAIGLAFGDAYLGAWLPLILITCAQLVMAFFGAAPILLAMSRGERYLLRIYAVAVLTGIAIAIPLIGRFGAAGAAIAMIATAALIGFACRHYARRRLGVDVTFLPLVQRTQRSR